MSDILCAKCGEPWDAYHVRHDMPADERRKFMSGQGCDACGYGTKCVDCSGTGRMGRDADRACSCSTCHNFRFVVVFRYAPLTLRIKRDEGVAPDAPWMVWTFGYNNTPDHPIRTDAGKVFYQYDGLETRAGVKLQQALALCPDCPDDVPACPTCGGSGEFTPANSEEMRFDAMRSAVEASDEDPFEIMAGYGLF